VTVIAVPLSPTNPFPHLPLSPLAVPAYLLGVVMLLMLYGTDGLDVWRARLAPSPSN
jgi:hypothetical protein